MSDTINVTESGRKYLQLYNINLYDKKRPQNQTIPTTLPQIQQPHQVQLHSLAFRLNKLLKSKLLIQAKAELSHNVTRIKNDIIRDLGYNNEYTSRRANELITKIMKNKQMGNKENQCTNCTAMEISKGKNYIARINYLHLQNKYKQEKNNQVIKKITNKDIHE